MIGQAAIGLRRQRFNVSQGRRCRFSPIVKLGCHDNVVGEVTAATKRLTEPPRMRNGWLWWCELGFHMMRIATGLAFGGLIFAVAVGAASTASANDLGPGVSTASLAREFAAQKKRPRVTIYPRRVYPGPYAKRQCYSWLVTEYRVSGTVVTPQMRCWWE